MLSIATSASFAKITKAEVKDVRFWCGVGRSFEKIVKHEGAFTKLKRFPPDLNRRDSQRVKDERIFVH